MCNTPDIADWTRRHGWHGGLRIISNFTFVRPAAPEPRARHRTPEDAFLVVAAGRLVELKGFRVLLHAAAKAPGAYLWIVGEGEQRPALEALVSELGLVNRVRLLGWQPEIAPFLAAANVVCLPSLHEPLGNVVLEGMGAGKPVVASRTAGPAWILRDGETGLLAEVGDPDSLAAALRRLGDDPTLCTDLARAAARDLETRFSEEAVCKEYLGLFGPKRFE